MKKFFTLISAVLLYSNAFAQCEACIQLKNGEEYCFPMEDVDEIHTKDCTDPGTDPEPLNHETVDLGLPSGLLWAKYDVGATGEKGIGQFFGWAETTTSEKYDYEDLKYYERDDDGYRFLKYVTSTQYIPNPDYLVTLLPEDDAATANWGAAWRTPTKEEWQEMIDACTWEQCVTPEVQIKYCESCTEVDSHGIIGTSKYNGEKIYFPEAGHWFGDTYAVTGKYWTSSVKEANHFEAWILWIGEHDSNYGLNLTTDSRYLGCGIRPVTKKK